MPLNDIPYNVNQGELYPYNSGNYTNRARAMMFFNSLEYGVVVGEDRLLSLTKSINITETNTLDNWPLSDAGGIVTYSNGDPIYTILYVAIANELTIILHKPSVDGATDFNNDEILYTVYLDNLDNILESNFRGFNFGDIQIGDDELVTAGQFISPTEAPTKEDLETQCNFSMIVQEDPFINSDLSSGFQYSSGIIDFNAFYDPETKLGNFIKVIGVPLSGIQVGSYLNIEATDSSNNGRFQVEEITTDSSDVQCIRVNRTDGLNFQETNFAGTITDISLRPRLKIRYRIPANNDSGGGGSSPTNVYKIYSAEDAGHFSGYKLLRNASSGLILNGNLASDELLFTSDERVFSIGGNNSINGPNLFIFPFGVPTTNASGGGTSTRSTPWRKAYRSINRFNPREINFRQFKEASYDGTIHYDFVRGPAIPSNNTESETYSYPAAIPHRPPAMHIDETSNGSNGRNEILITNKISSFSSTGTVRIVGGKPVLSHNADHWIDNTTDGFVLEESNNPNVMSFTANLNDTNNDGGQFTYDYDGLVSCKETVIPAYSGEILHFDTNFGFVANNYSLPDGGGIARTAAFVDITETDEVLRWNGSNYDPVAAWRSTFGNMTITNGTNVIELNNHAVLKTDKNHYVVIMYSTTDVFTINDGDEIQVTMASKQVITNPQANELPSSSEYGPIAYRSMNEEHIDDHRREYIEPSLRNFTITSDGTIDGNITINYDGDVPSGTQFRLFIQDDEEGTP